MSQQIEIDIGGTLLCHSLFEMAVGEIYLSHIVNRHTFMRDRTVSQSIEID